MTLEQDCPNSLAIIRQVEQTHRGLGLVADFLTTSMLAQKGVLLSGLVETGKSRITTCVRNQVEEMTNWLAYEGVLTPAALGQKDMIDKMTAWNNANVIWTAIELANTSYETLDASLRLASSILEDGQFKYHTQISHVDIQDCRMSFIGCMTLDYLQDLVRTRKWVGNYSQRFLRYYLMPFMPFKTTEITPRFHLAQKINFSEKIRVGLSEQDKEKKKWLQLFLMIYSQIQEKRAEIYTDNLLLSHAWLNGRQQVAESDYDLLLLHYPNLFSEAWFAYREKPSEPITYNLDDMMYFAHCLQYQHKPEKRNIEQIALRFHQKPDTARKYLSACPYLNTKNGNPHNYYEPKREYAIWFEIQQKFLEGLK